MKIMAGNSGKDPAGIARRSTRRTTSISWLVPRDFSLSNMAPERFFLGGRGSVCFETESHLKEFHFISTEKVFFYATDSFPRRRHISTAEAHFYRGGVFLRGGVSLRRKCISMKEVNLKAIGLSLVWKRGTNARRR